MIEVAFGLGNDRIMVVLGGCGPLLQEDEDVAFVRRRRRRLARARPVPPPAPASESRGIWIGGSPRSKEVS